MDGWMDGWTDGRRDGWMDGWKITSRFVLVCFALQNIFEYAHQWMGKCIEGATRNMRAIPEFT